MTATSRRIVCVYSHYLGAEGTNSVNTKHKTRSFAIDSQTCPNEYSLVARFFRSLAVIEFGEEKSIYVTIDSRYRGIQIGNFAFRFSILLFRLRKKKLLFDFSDFSDLFLAP